MKETARKQPILTFVVIFIAGFVCGAVFAVFQLNQLDSPAVGSSQQASQQSSDLNQAINNLEAEVTQNPENFNAWVQLGHLYFDSSQYHKAITAYTTSLQYHSGDANLLTDLGVMYRRTGNPEKALEYFEQAQEMDSNHQQSRYNEGIVRYYDLEDLEGAIASWEELLLINPDAMAGRDEKLRDFVDKLKAGDNQ